MPTKEEEDAEYEMFLKDQAIVEETFPDAKFDVCIYPADFDDECCDGRTDVMIRHKCECYCWDNTPHLRPTYFIHVTNTKPITNRMVANALIENGFNPDCNHRFFEGVYKKNRGNNESMEYELCMGS